GFWILDCREMAVAPSALVKKWSTSAAADRDAFQFYSFRNRSRSRGECVAERMCPLCRFRADENNLISSLENSDHAGWRFDKTSNRIQCAVRMIAASKAVGSQRGRESFRVFISLANAFPNESISVV